MYTASCRLLDGCLQELKHVSVLPCLYLKERMYGSGRDMPTVEAWDLLSHVTKVFILSVASSQNGEKPARLLFLSEFLYNNVFRTSTDHMPYKPMRVPVSCVYSSS